MGNIDEVGIDELRNLLKENKPFNEIMTDVMKIGSELAKKIGHKDYPSIEAFLEEIKNHASPLFYIDDEVVTNFEGVGTNLIGVKTCPFKEIMKTMSASGTSDAKVDTILHGFQMREGEESHFIDLGCYVAQQLRQMVLSSITINGEYLLNYIHLGCDKGTGKRVKSKGDISSIGLDESTLDRLLDEVDCVYAISYKEGMEE